MVYGSVISNRIQIHLLKDFSHPKSSTCSANLNSGGFGKLNLENTFWPNYFCKKILYCTIHMAWSLGQKFGARGWSIEGGVVLTLKSTWKTHRENQLQVKSQIMQKFLSNHTLSWFISLSVVAWKSGCDKDWWVG